MRIRRRYPIGAEIIPNQGIHFRVFAPDHKKVYLNIENNKMAMLDEKNGYFSCLSKEAKEGTLYTFEIKGKKLPDPASRFQPFGPNGPSEVINPEYKWTDKKWKGHSIEGQVIYEMHVGTFTKEGTYKGAIEQLNELASIGITMIELMPLNDFPGNFGWGYDGVNLFSPTRLYGRPEDLKAFINKAHTLKIAVILDVVYNHLGPEFNYLPLFAKNYLLKDKPTDWGDTINFDDKDSRKFFLTNIQYWIEEFHFDGLRVDAMDCIHSTTKKPILAEMTEVAKKSAPNKNIVVIGENEQQKVENLDSYEEGGNGFDALWNDDFHHSALVRITGKREAYYTDYLGSPQEFISLYKYGYLYQGQYYDWQKKTRGSSNLSLNPASMIVFLENHDQVANSLYGTRLYHRSEPQNFKALTGYFLLTPNTPMIFQGQEFGSSKNFHYFADHSENLNASIRKGRRISLSQFPRLATQEVEKILPDPSDLNTFTQCKLEFNERKINGPIYQLHKDLLFLRKTDAVFSNMDKVFIDGAVLGTDSFLIRYFGINEDRLLIVNFGPDHYFNPAPEPLLVPGKNLEWEILWSSESVEYGGEGTPPINVPYWKILGHSAIVLKPKIIDKNA